MFMDGYMLCVCCILNYFMYCYIGVWAIGPKVALGLNVKLGELLQ